MNVNTGVNIVNVNAADKVNTLNLNTGVNTVNVNRGVNTVNGGEICTRVAPSCPEYFHPPHPHNNNVPLLCTE